MENRADPSVFEKKFFASSNSSGGFKNDYASGFGEGSGIERLFVVKGGPGTGKSHFMRTVARQAEKHGYTPTYYCCSSDPASLDGVILEGKELPTLGFLDGTAPHVWEPTLPGAYDEIINLGVFWNADRLRVRSGEIRRLNREKSRGYRRAYDYLGACGHVTAVADDLVADAAEKEKLNALAARLLRSQRSGTRFSERLAHTRGIGMSGCVSFDTYEQMARRSEGEVVYIESCYGLEYFLTAALYAQAKKQRLSLLVSHHPIHTHKIDGLYFTDGRLAILTGPTEDAPTQCRRISLRRYLQTERFKEVRAEVRHALKMAEEQKDCACQSLRTVAEYHFAIEKIYAEAMDFEAKDKFDKDFCRKLFEGLPSLGEGR